MCLTFAASMWQRHNLNKRDFYMELFSLPSTPQGTARTSLMILLSFTIECFIVKMVAQLTEIMNTE